MVPRNATATAKPEQHLALGGGMAQFQRLVQLGTACARDSREQHADQHAFQQRGTATARSQRLAESEIAGGRHDEIVDAAAGQGGGEKPGHSPPQ